MASYGKFQNDFSRYAGGSNQFKAPKVMLKAKEISENKRDNLIDWITFYRRNMHRFIQHYFQVKLYWYQIIWIYFMSICDNFITVASRASAKSWIIALVALARGVLYPGSEIVIVAKSQKQAGIIFDKIGLLMNDYPNIAREIKTYTKNQSHTLCLLHNASTIKVVACDESGRGNRSTFTIGEEFRLMNKSKFDAIVKPFAYARQTPYIKTPEYKHLIEEPREVLITSAYYKNMWWYEETMTVIRSMIEGQSTGFIAFDYLIAIKEGIKTKKIISRDRKSMGEIDFMQEYENIPYGESANAYFKLEMFEKNRKMKKAFYPLRDDILDKKKNPYDIKRVDGEIRIVSADIATRKASENDNTIILCIRLIPTQAGYNREICYMESHQGEHTGIQSLRIKQVYYDFNADYIVLDLLQAGIAIYEQLAVVTKDEERGIEYPPLSVFEHKSLPQSLIDELNEKTLGLNAMPVIYPIRANAVLNSNIAVDFRDKLQRRMLNFLVNETEAEEYLAKTEKEFKRGDDPYINTWFISPYLETQLLISECINLEQSISGGNVKVETSGHARKDRYTACSYGNYFASLLENDFLKGDGDSDYDFVFSYS
jgi:hypothetical protein